VGPEGGKQEMKAPMEVNSLADEHEEFVKNLALQANVP
jgi:hypothetical protein